MPTDQASLEPQNNSTTQLLSNEPADHQPLARKRNPLVFILVLLLVIIGGALAYFIYQNQLLITRLSQPNLNKQPIISPTQEPNNVYQNWQSYQIKSLGVSLKLPPEITKKNKIEENIYPGERGNIVCFSAKDKQTSWLAKPIYAGGGRCSFATFGIAANSTDFEAGQSGVFSDNAGYLIRDGQYYAKSVQNKDFLIKTELAEEITNANQVKILKITGQDVKVENMGMPGTPANPGASWLRALINLDNPNYRGLNIQMKITDELNETIFNQILDSIKLDQALQETENSWQSNKNEIGDIISQYLEAVINEDEETAMSFLTQQTKESLKGKNWLEGYGVFKIYEVLNEFHSPAEEQAFYQQETMTFAAKLYKENDQAGNQISLMFIKEDDQWKTISWYLLP